MNKVNLQRLHDRFTEIVREYMYKHKLSGIKLASQLGMADSRLSDLITKNAATGEYRRPLTASYLIAFIEGGIMKAEDIWDGQYEDAKEKTFWRVARILSNHELTDIMEKIGKLGGDPVPVLMGYLYGLEKAASSLG